MNSRNYKYALLLVAAVSITTTGAMSQAYAQSVDDGMDGYVKGTSGIYTGNPNECWYEDGEGGYGNKGVRGEGESARNGEDRVDIGG